MYLFQGNARVKQFFLSLHFFSNACPIFALSLATRLAVAKGLLVLWTTATILENNNNNLLPSAKKNALYIFSNYVNDCLAVLLKKEKLPLNFNYILISYIFFSIPLVLTEISALSHISSPSLAFGACKPFQGRVPKVFWCFGLTCS